jgi:hypothetical protein
MTGYTPSMREREQRGWVVGFTVFAGVMMIMIGAFQVITGLAAIINSTFYTVTPNYIIQFSAAGWGWVHLIFGVLIAITGFAILAEQPWARVVGIFLALLSAIANFLFIPYYPVWSILIIALDIVVICALASYGRPGGVRA